MRVWIIYHWPNDVVVYGTLEQAKRHTESLVPGDFSWWESQLWGGFRKWHYGNPEKMVSEAIIMIKRLVQL